MAASLKVQGANLGDDVAGSFGDEVAGLRPGQAAFRDASVASNANAAPVKILDADKFTNAAGEVVEGAGTVTHGSSYTGTQNYVNFVDDAGNVGTNVKNFDVIKNTGGENLVTNPLPNVSNEFNPLYSDANAAAKGWNYIDATKGEWDKISYRDWETAKERV